MSSPPRAPDRETRFRTLYAESYADLCRFAARRVPPSRVEDVVADAFLVVWRRLDDLPADLDDARAWLFGITRRTILNSRRGVARQQALAVRLAEVAATQHPQAGQSWADDLVASRLDVAAGWQRLSAVHQESLALAVLDELTSHQAARVLGISPVAFRLRLSRARRALRLHVDSLPQLAQLPRRAALAPPLTDRISS